MVKRNCYQCPEGVETLDEIRDRRNAEIRAWGRKVLEDADKALLAEQGGSVPAPSDWDILDDDSEDDLRIVVNVPVEEGTEEDMDALAATQPQETKEIQKKIDESPKPATQANDESKEDVAAGDAPAEVEAPVDEPVEAPVEEPKEEKPVAKKATTKSKAASSKETADDK